MEGETTQGDRQEGGVHCGGGSGGAAVEEAHCHPAVRAFLLGFNKHHMGQLVTSDKLMVLS